MAKLESLSNRYHAIALLSSMDHSGFRTWRLYLIVMDQPNCLCACLTCFSVLMSRDSRTTIVIFRDWSGSWTFPHTQSSTCCLFPEFANVRINHIAFFMESIDIEVSLVAILYFDLLLDCPILLYCTHRLEYRVDTFIRDACIPIVFIFRLK